ncbi:MAG: hypothetical protein AAB150_12760 [Pseudomonadota bacterium]
MSEVIVFREGGYRYIKAQFQYPSGVAAEAGFEIERARAPVIGLECKMYVRGATRELLI